MKGSRVGSMKTYSVHRSRLPGPFRTSTAILTICLGTSIAWCGQVCFNASHVLAGDASLRGWHHLIHTFTAAPTRARHLPAWERHLLHNGPPIVLAILGALVVLWTLLGIGGALFWLTANGYGMLLLGGTVVVGALVGRSIARLHHQTHHDLN